MLIRDTVMQWRRHHEAFYWSCAFLLLDALPLTQRIPLIRTPRRELQASCTVVGSLHVPAQFDASLINQIELYLVPLEENKSAYQVNARQTPDL